MLSAQSAGRALRQATQIGRHGSRRSLSVNAATPERLTDYRAVGVGVGDVLHGFEVSRVTPVDEFQLTAVELRHRASGAEWLHVARADSNNVFTAAFRTTPNDSTGAPHILEHTVLCGSRRFPARDPFFKMLYRSLASYMNALTASDWTAYPFSTTNKQDYYNLLEVYLDAVFFPNLNRLDFMQEGWRLEHADPQDTSTALEFKGVVYNEMKGVFSSPDNVFYTQAQTSLYPGTTYEHVSGGDPNAITALSWEELKAFHAKYYHPSNCRFYSYGDLPLGDHLEAVVDNALSQFAAQPSDSTAVNNVPRWTSPREVFTTCPEDAVATDPDRQSRVSVSYLLTQVTDLYDLLVLRIITSVLTDSPSAPFFKSLIESKLGSDFSCTTGFNTHARETSFSVGVQGAHSDDRDAVIAAIHDTFQRVIDEGLDRAEIDATLHQIELSRKHQTASFGMNLGIGVLGSWIHGGDPVAQLQLDPLLDRFVRDLDDPAFVPAILQKYFINNPHRLTLTTEPDAQYAADLDEKEAARLAAMIEALSDADRADIAETGRLLQDKQNEVDSSDSLPTLAVSDIERRAVYDVVRNEVSERRCGATSVQTPVTISEQPTNGVLYFKALVDVNGLPDELQEYMPVFSSVLTQLGAGERDYRALAQTIKHHTGGLGCKANLPGDPEDNGRFRQEVLISSHCLQRNVGAMFELWHDVFTAPRFDEIDHLRTLVTMAAADVATSIPDAGHTYAQLYAASSISGAYSLSNRRSGLPQVAFLQRLAAADQGSNVDALVVKLREIASWVLETDRLKCLLVADDATLAASQPAFEGFLNSLPAPSVAAREARSAEPFAFEAGTMPSTHGDKTYFKTPFTVNYAARSIETVPFSHPDSAPLAVLAKAMTANYLHREIREKGGAYGGGAAARSNLFNFYSYRDPNSVDTLRAFDASSQWAADGHITQAHVDEAKLGLFQSVDAPVSPAARGSRQFLTGVTDAMKQQRRERLLDVQPEDVVRVARQYLLGDQPEASAIIGPEAGAQQFSESDGWTVTSVES